MSVICETVLTKRKNTRPARDELEKFLIENQEAGGWEAKGPELWGLTVAVQQEGKPRQGELPSVDRPSNDRVEEAARAYHQTVDKRLKLQKKEAEQKQLLDTACVAEGVTDFYRYIDQDTGKPMVVTIAAGERTVSVKVDRDRARKLAAK